VSAHAEGARAEVAHPQVAGAGPMLNAYPDSIGGHLGDIVAFLGRPELTGVFESFYVLPSLFHTDLDRGFSVIDYGLNRQLASEADLKTLRDSGVDLKLDFILNHASVLSPQFQDIIAKGEQSPYRDFFIDWNQFWAGHGTMTPDGHIQPNADLIKDMFFRKPGLPILSVRFPDGQEVPYWNTFYQEVRYTVPEQQELMRALHLQYGEAEQLEALLRTELSAKKKPVDIEYGAFAEHRAAIINLLESRRVYLGQMDLNIRSPLVWEFYDATLKQLAAYGASIVRLDAFAYAPKAVGKRNFFNDPETWECLERVNGIAKKYGVQLLPEIHTSYGERTHEAIAARGYLTYDFFLPGLIIDAFERQTNDAILRWVADIQAKGIRTVNMLGCHDGIPLLDLKGLLTDAQIDALIATVVARGGYVKDLHGQKNLYYQVNATYFSALGEDEQKLLLARAIQIFMPGKPQVWYLDLFAGKNNHAAVEQAGSGGHKEINRTNLSEADIDAGLQRDVVKTQLDLLRFRARCKAFGFDATLEVLPSAPHELTLRWSKDGAMATLQADLRAYTYSISEG
jgi:sucrose phosphorylase